jgi:hypothetical protein
MPTIESHFCMGYFLHAILKCMSQANVASIITGAVFNVDIFCKAWHDASTATGHCFLV